MSFKLFNPFKAHIFQFSSGKFAVRRLRVGWQYYDNQKVAEDKYWWKTYTDNNNRYFLLDTLEEANLLLDTYWRHK